MFVPVSVNFFLSGINLQESFRDNVKYFIGPLQSNIKHDWQEKLQKRKQKR